MKRKIPLAWLQLTREKSRFLVALAGITFADILIFMQLGFKEALFDGNVRLHSALEGDIVLINPNSNSSIKMNSFSQRRLYQALSFKSVKSVHPIYLDFTSWKNPECHKFQKLTNRNTQICKPRNILVIGIKPENNILNLPGIQQNINKIKLPDVVLFDRGSRTEFGPVFKNFTQGKITTTEVGGRRIKVKGIFEMGASFAADGNLITSDINFFRILEDKQRKRGLIEIGLIKLQPGADPKDAISKLREFYCQNNNDLSKNNIKNYQCKDVEVLSKQEFIEFEKNYWASNTAIGFMFTLGAVMGFVVGTVIVYQILYSAVADHLPEYATLKAIGYTQNYLLFVVFQEALILATIGYVPGFAFAIFQYNMARQATLLPLFMTTSRALTVLLLTILMCLVSGLITVRKLRSADPADIF